MFIIRVLKDIVTGYAAYQIYKNFLKHELKYV